MQKKLILPILNQSITEKYLEDNLSFSKKCVFRLGAEAGFFSEYNNLILFALYCYSKNISLLINSEYANFAYKNGWADFFNSILPEHKSVVHCLNVRPYQIVNHLSYPFLSLYKKVSEIDYFTQDLWKECRRISNKTDLEFSFPHLSFDGNLIEALHLFNSLLFKPNMNVLDYLRNLKTRTGLPEKYISFHIRQGDKSKENELYGIHKYFETEFIDPNIKDAFIYTDDLVIIKEIEKKYPEWNLYYDDASLSGGYNHQNFQTLKPEIKYQLHIALIANTILMSESTQFIGTTSSNIGVFVGICKKNQNCTFVDHGKWIFW